MRAFAIVSDIKGSGNDGNELTGGQYSVRPLNVIESDENDLVNLDGNDIVFQKSGTFEICALMPVKAAEL